MKLHVITLQGQKQRLFKTTNLFLNKKDPLNFNYAAFTFTRNDKDPIKGCTDSHMTLYEYADKKKMPYIAIMEDNCCLAPNAHMWDSGPFLNLLPDRKRWDVIYLGGWYVPFLGSCKQDKLISGMYRTTSIHGTSCYVISRRGYQYMLRHRHEVTGHIDRFISERLRCFICDPFLFHRSQTPSMINGPLYGYFRICIYNKYLYRIQRFLFFKKYPIFKMVGILFLLYLLR